MKIKISLLILFFITTILLFTCQDMFTSNLFSSFQRDPSNFSDAQKINYAQDILSSGSTEEMADAYELIDDMLTDDPDNTELLLLAADLALGGSGVLEVMDDVIDESSLEAALDTLDLVLVQAAADNVQAAEALGADISEAQYLNTGVILLGQAADEAGSFANLDLLNGSIPAVVPPDPVAWETLLQADTYITQGGGDISDYGITNANLP